MCYMYSHAVSIVLWFSAVTTVLVCVTPLHCDVDHSYIMCTYSVPPPLTYVHLSHISFMYGVFFRFLLYPLYRWVRIWELYVLAPRSNIGLFSPLRATADLSLMALSRHPHYIQCIACLVRESSLDHVNCYCIECRSVLCECISLDQFYYHICNMSTICLVQDDHDGLFLARVGHSRGQEIEWNSLLPGDYRVWRSGWTIRVSESNRCNWTSMSGFHHLYACQFVPLKAFGKLKVLVRLMIIAKRCVNLETPFRFCGGRELLRLSQAAVRFKCFSEENYIGYLGAVVGRMEWSR